MDEKPIDLEKEIKEENKQNTINVKPIIFNNEFKGE